MRFLLRFFAVLAVVLAGGALSVACSHAVESPEVKLTKLEPSLICNDQFPAEGIPVKIHGDGFTPMPVKTLEDESSIELPAVSLARAYMLDGTEADGPALSISGKAGGENADHLSWQSNELMTLKFDPALAPEPGLYSVTVTNPDGEHSATLKVGLGVVPPPMVTAQSLAHCNSTQDGQLTIAGTNFVKFGDEMPTVIVKKADGTVYKTYTATSVGGCKPLTELDDTIQICTSVTIDIPGNDLPPGTYEVVISNPASVGCASASVTLKVVADSPILFFADPPFVYNGINTQITLYLTAITVPAEVMIVPTGQTEPVTTLVSTPVPNKAGRLQATVPKDQAPGEYDILVKDGTGCTTKLEKGLTVTDKTGLNLKSIVPPFGQTLETTNVTIFRDTAGGVPFAATPRAFLNPVNAGSGDVAIQLESVTFVDGDTLTAVVPKNTPVKAYDVVVVNPTGEVGVLQNAYQSITANPPVISDVLPQSIVNQAGQTITVKGSNFSAGAQVSLRCVDAAGSPIAAPAVVSQAVTCPTATDCSVSATVDGAALPAGSVCVVRVTNADGSWGEFSAVGVTNSSFNLSQPKAGPALKTGRRALVSAAVKATSASRYVYAIAGDGGSGTSLFPTVEIAPVDVFGKMSAWFDNRENLKMARAFHGGTSIGRYLYVFGGTDGTNAVKTTERALVLSPEEVPHIEDLDLCLSGGKTPCFDQVGIGEGLEAGGYSYRVAAMIATDPENIGGETLASDPVIMKLPAIQGGRKISVKLTWSKSIDSLGVPLSGVSGYRVYRVAKDGVPGKDEKLLAELTGADTLTFIDDGTKPLGTALSPLPPGSTSMWQSLPDLGTGRVGAATAVARDPGVAGTWHLYALLGKSSGGEAGGGELASFESLSVAIKPNGRQTVGAAWKAGSQAAGVGRWQAGAWTVDNVAAQVVTPGDTWIFLGAGKVGTNTDGKVEAAKVVTGGDLTAFDPVPEDFSSVRVGYGTAAAAGRLFCFGGDSNGPKDNATSAEAITPPPTLKNNAWNNEGLQMTTPRYLMGHAIQSAFIFLVGGESTNSGTVTSSTELVVW